MSENSNVAPVEKTETYNWHLRASEYHGKLSIEFNTNAPFEAGGASRVGHIKVYKGEFPSNPGEQHDHYYHDTDPSPYRPDLPWGAGWRIAWVGEKNGQWHYIVKIVT